MTKLLQFGVILLLAALFPGGLRAEWYSSSSTAPLQPWSCEYRVLSFNKFADGSIVTPLTGTDFIVLDTGGRASPVTVRFTALGESARHMKGFVVESQRNDFDSVFSDGMQTSCTLNIESAKTRAFSRRQTGSSLSYSIVCSFFNDAASGRAAFEVDATAVTLQSSCRN